MASLIRHPSAFLPVAMSLTALALVLCVVFHDIAVYGTVIREADEGTAAHLWQLLIVGQVPIVAFFVIRWLPHTPRAALGVLALQSVAGLAAVTPVYLLHL